MRPHKTTSILLFIMMFSVSGFNTTDLQAQPRPAMAPARPAPAMTARPAPRPATRPAPVASRPAMAPAAMAAPATQPTSTTAAPAASEPKPPAAPENPKANPKADTWWKVLIGRLLEILLVFVLALGTALGGLLVKWVAKKAKITDQEQIAGMEKLYDLAVSFGVNFARQQAKKLSGNPDSKAKRLEWALEKAQEFISEWKLPDKTASWIKKKIEAKIGAEERA